MLVLSIDVQADLEPVVVALLEVTAVGRNGAKFSQYTVVWRGFQDGLGFQDVKSLILVDALFLLDGG
jgi:hypothetical protein